MGFSYVAAAAILLSSTLIFFGMVYSGFVQSNLEIHNSGVQYDHQRYDYLNSNVNITGYNVVNESTANASAYKVYINMTNTGSVTLNMNSTDILVNGIMTGFNSSAEYLFPLGKGNVSFNVNSTSTYDVEIVFSTGYEKYAKVTA
ncbi:hypothetical protein IX51_11245 [uncultured archaeon]|nr:hypothetical protein IX51_11245 [uncultured archaeon]